MTDSLLRPFVLSIESLKVDYDQSRRPPVSRPPVPQANIVFTKFSQKFKIRAYTANTYIT
jgi:hypothetical protein